MENEEMDIFDLNEIAGEIMVELTKYSSVKNEIDDASNADEDRVHHQSKAGSLASKECVGNTPYLIVYKGKGIEVSIRRGFELYRPKDPASKKVEDINIELAVLPSRYYLNGEYYDNSREDRPFNLLTLVGENEELAERLFLGKHINEIHIRFIDSFRWIYNIDICDQQIEGDISVRPSDNDKLENLAGRKLGTSKGRCSFQEDLIVTFFSQILFGDATKSRDQLQAFQAWSLDKIREIVQPSKKGDMYVGFCFGALLDVGYSSQNWVTGSRNVLLLALTRGFIKLSDNLYNEKKHWDPIFKDEFEKKQTCKMLRKRATNDDTEEASAGKDMPTLKDVTKDRITVYTQGVYLGSTGKGIVVKVKRSPLRLFWIWTLVVLSLFGFPYMYWTGGYDGEDWTGVFRAIGSIIELWGAIIALGFLAMKSCFAEWTILDMFKSRKRCESLEELIQVMKYTEKRSFIDAIMNPFHRFSKKYKEKYKIKAIRLCAMLPIPENIFSYYNSCAFAVDGQGEFEVDVSIDIKNLTDAGYCFGVNYYGDPIVKDAKGDIRKVHFEEICKESTISMECNCKHESVIIGAYHPLQPNKIFHLVTKNRIVGMHKKEQLSLTSSVDSNV